MSELAQSPSPLYGDGSRSLQEEFDSTRLANKLVEWTLHGELTDDDVTLVSAQSTVWIATVDADGWPDLSYKGGAPGFVRVTDRTHLQIPNYDGNGMFRTLGNIRDNGRVALLFLDPNKPWRIRLHGTATVSTAPEDIAQLPGAKAVITVELARIFPNCGRYIHTGGEISKYVPDGETDPPMAEWKRLPGITDVLPAADQERIRAEDAGNG